MSGAQSFLQFSLAVYIFGLVRALRCIAYSEEFRINLANTVHRDGLSKLEHPTLAISSQHTPLTPTSVPFR